MSMGMCQSYPVTKEKKKEKKKKANERTELDHCVLQTAICVRTPRPQGPRTIRSIFRCFSFGPVSESREFELPPTRVQRPNKLPISFQRKLSYEGLFWTRSPLSNVIDSKSGEFFRRLSNTIILHVIARVRSIRPFESVSRDDCHKSACTNR